MRIRLLLYILGVLFICLGISMLIPLLISLYYNGRDSGAFLKASLLTTVIGLILFFSCRTTREEISHREGFAIVTLSWIGAGAVGSLPYYFSGTFDSYVNCFFESISGFTTTGATVLTTIEALPHGILFWRSLTQWFGGMGIILLSVAILPLLGVGGMQLYRAEVPGPMKDKIKPRVAETAKTLWKVYILISGLETFFLLLGGMNLFDALCHAFTTLATGGFSTKNASIEDFHSPFIDATITLFMLAAGVNFSLHYRTLKGNPRGYWKSTEFRFFTLIFGVSSLFIILNLRLSLFDNLMDAVRYGTFQAASILTTTGYSTADFEKWPSFSCFILVLLMFIGGSSGSTGGGMKCIRMLILIKSSYRELHRLIHPHAVIPVKLEGNLLSQEIVQSIWGFFFLYLLLAFLASLGMALLGMDLVSAFVAVAASIGNVGPGLGTVGPADNYNHIQPIGKWILSLCMILGRLEIYTVLVLFTRDFWKK